MKIAVSGKGGVGKTTVSALLAGALALKGHGVIALDADPDANLASALGAGDEPLTPLCEMREMIAERTGAKDAYGGYFKLNPRVDDIPDQFARKLGPIHLLVLGGIARGGSGCLCPASALLKALLVHLLIGRDEAVIMDMEAGIEHLGRATAKSMDALILVIDPGPWSLQTALRIRRLAGDIGLTRLFAVANRVDPAADLSAMAAGLEGIPLIGSLPSDPLLASPALLLEDGHIRPGPGLQAHLPKIEAILGELSGRL